MKEEAKKEVMIFVEDVTKGSVKAAFNLIKNLVKKTETKTDDNLLPVIEWLEAKILSYADKIDGEISNA